MRSGKLLLVLCFLASGVVWNQSPALAAPEKTIELTFANFFPPAADQSKACEEFIRDLEMRTAGRVKVKYHGGGSLLSGAGMHKGIVGGIADIGYSHVYYTPGRMLVMEFLGLPLGNQTGWVGSHALNDFYFKFQPKEFDDVKILWLNGAAPASINTTKPVRKLDDLKGLKIRAPGVMGEIIAALGGTPTPTPMPEVYDAIAKGVDDGAFGVFEMLKTFRLAEVVKYATSTWHVGNNWPFYMAMNKASYGRLPADVKKIFDQLCGEYAERFALIWNAVDMVGVSFGKAKGVEFIELPDPPAWKKAVDPLMEQWVKKLVGAGYKEPEIRSWMSFMQERYGFYTKKQIEYGIPAGTGPKELRPENIGK